MKRTVLFSAVVVLVGVVYTQGAITLLQNDQVTFNGQISGESAGHGGAFDWQVAVLTHPLSAYGSNPPSVGDHFTTFCVELTQTISAGSTYVVKTNPFAHGGRCREYLGKHVERLKRRFPLSGVV